MFIDATEHLMNAVFRLIYRSPQQLYGGNNFVIVFSFVINKAKHESLRKVAIS